MTVNFTFCIHCTFFFLHFLLQFLFFCSSNNERIEANDENQETIKPVLFFPGCEKLRQKHIAML